MTQGWECPKCGTCYGPFVQKCETCGPRTFTTYGTDAHCAHVFDYATTAPHCVKCGASPVKPWPTRVVQAREGEK